MYKKIKRARFDWGIDLKNSLLNTALLLWAPGIKKRVAATYYHENLSPLFLTNPVKIRTFETTEHITKENIKIINEGLGLKRKNYMPEILTDKKDTAEVENFMRKNNLKKEEYICISPTASLLYKQWSAKNYSEIVKWLKKKNIRIVLTGTEKDRELLKNIAGDNRNCIILTNFNLRLLSILFKNSKVVLTNDGGPMHLSWAAEAKTIALFAKFPSEWLKRQKDAGKKVTPHYYKKVFPLKNSVVIQSKGKTINDISINEVITTLSREF